MYDPVEDKGKTFPRMSAFGPRYSQNVACNRQGMVFLLEMPFAKMPLTETKFQNEAVVDHS